MGTLTVDGLTTSYGSVTAVDGLDLEIADGEFFVILGPSGAGKTTTLKSVAGLVDIDHGRVTIGGRDMTGVEPYHRNVAMAFESYALYPQKTVAQNLASPLRSGRTGRYSEADQNERIDTVTTTLGINHLLGRLPSELSNGQRQRTALGRVLVRPADVYLLDEPLSHLDAKLRAAMRAELKTLGQMSNTTTVYVTHDYQEALALGDRIAVLHQGRLIQVDSPQRVWRRPADTFVAKSLGQPEINLLRGEVTDGRIAACGTTFAVPDGLEVAAGDRVLVGMRPSELEVGRGDLPDGWVEMTGSVKLAERLGRQIELDVDVAGEQLIAVDAHDHPAAEGDQIRLRIELRNIHLFAAPTAEHEETPRLGGAGPRETAREER
jgi:multiple sugar transport system ATP-binding protein